MILIIHSLRFDHTQFMIYKDICMVPQTKSTKYSPEQQPGAALLFIRLILLSVKITSLRTDPIGCDDGALYFRVREICRKYRQERALNLETKDCGSGQVGGEQGNGRGP